MGRYYKARLGRWPSGQWQQTVNLPGFALRVFESHPAHQQEPREIGVFCSTVLVAGELKSERSIVKVSKFTATRTATTEKPWPEGINFRPGEP